MEAFVSPKCYLVMIFKCWLGAVQHLGICQDFYEIFRGAVFTWEKGKHLKMDNFRAIQWYTVILKEDWGTSLIVQWLRLLLPMHRMPVWSLVRELKSHMPCGQKNQNIKNRSKIVTKSIKTLKMVHIKKKKMRMSQWGSGCEIQVVITFHLSSFFLSSFMQPCKKWPF